MKLSIVRVIKNFIKPYTVSVNILTGQNKYSWKVERNFYFWERRKAEHYCYKRFHDQTLIKEAMVRNLYKGMRVLLLVKHTLLKESGLTRFKDKDGDFIKDLNGRDIYLGDVVRCYGGEYCAGAYEFDTTFVVAYDIKTFLNLEHSEYIEIQTDRIHIGNNRHYSRKALLRDMDAFINTLKNKQDEI
jgi:hypothetical protein